MSRFLENKVVYATICLLFGLALCANFWNVGSIPSFATALVPAVDQTLISDAHSNLNQGTLPPPDPHDPVQIAQGTLPPPDPHDPVRIA